MASRARDRNRSAASTPTGAASAGAEIRLDFSWTRACARRTMPRRAFAPRSLKPKYAWSSSPRPRVSGLREETSEPPARESSEGRLVAESNAARDASAFARTSAGAGLCRALQTPDRDRSKPVISMRSASPPFKSGPSPALFLVLLLGCGGRTDLPALSTAGETPGEDASMRGSDGGAPGPCPPSVVPPTATRKRLGASSPTGVASVFAVTRWDTTRLDHRATSGPCRDCA